MLHRAFVAYSSVDSLVADAIVGACADACTLEREFQPWNSNDTSGRPIDRSVLESIERADSLVADVSDPNHNVTYEIGLAIGMSKPVRLIRAASKNRHVLEEIGLLHNLGHDDYSNRARLALILTALKPTPPWPTPKRNREQPLYFVQSSQSDDFLARVASEIKKTIKLRFRSFNPREIDRLTATEAFDQVAQSFGVIVVWNADDAPNAFRQNQRAAFVTGLARGFDLPFLLLANQRHRLPLDLDEIATRWSTPSDVGAILRQFRDDVYDAQQAFAEIRPGHERFLDLVHCGDPAAENEAAQLDSYFLETEQFRLTAAGDLNLLLGRKGSGKTAIFLQTRDKTRAVKDNIVVDLHPESFQLVRLKEFILHHLSHGARNEFLAAFWEYIIWLEIAYKLLKKDATRARHDSRLLDRYDRLQEAYKRRVEGEGDFAQRLAGLTDRILGRYEARHREDGPDLTSGRILEVVYGSEIRTIREEIFEYLRLKGIICFLFDNLDRFRTPAGFDHTDALIIIGLIEALSDLKKRFCQKELDFNWAIFLRSDVYEFVVAGMADYGKLAAASCEWNDRELIVRMFKKRLLGGLGKGYESWADVWKRVSVQTVNGRPTLDFLVDSSLMRPRYLIRLFETARRRAVTLERDRVEEADYGVALEELGWQVLEDFDQELVDVVPHADKLIFDIAQLGAEMSLGALREVIGLRVAESKTIEAVIDVLVWSGCIGVRTGDGVRYISDCGFKRPYLRALLREPDARSIVFHPTLASIISGPQRVATSN
jgi:hypothetical protein